jgi:putative glycerol-1-phosphate prenyltransferase
LTFKTLSFIEQASAQQQKMLAVLIDPDNKSEDIKALCKVCNEVSVDFIFCGGSLVTQGQSDACIKLIKQQTNIPVVIFPGNEMHVSNAADAILFLSLVSGRNAEYLIGKQVVSAPFLRRSGIEVMPTGYLLVDGGRTTTVNYVSQTIPIPANKSDVAAATALASTMLGQKLIYMDAGSGALSSIPASMIRKVKDTVEVPIIIGGGIDTAEKAFATYDAGADVVVVGNALEKAPGLLHKLIAARDSFKLQRVKINP